MKRTLGNLIIIIYVIVAITVTLCLLSYNERIIQKGSHLYERF